MSQSEGIHVHQRKGGAFGSPDKVGGEFPGRKDQAGLPYLLSLFERPQIRSVGKIKWEHSGYHERRELEKHQQQNGVHEHQGCSLVNGGESPAGKPGDDKHYSRQANENCP